MKPFHPQITWEEIPQHKDVTLIPVEKNYKKVLLIHCGILWLIFSAIAVALFLLVDSLQSPLIILSSIIGILLFAGFHFYSIGKAFS